VSACQVKLGTNDLNCVDVPLNPTHSLIHPHMSIENFNLEALLTAG